ncbi:choice-of-anchor G family protein [Promicromonospora sukumoe]|uniref:choice-of-anchor G family protein n=1 Tax=Promicromonospora sukumoe TaxID=88382 RepID=UPI0037C7F88D
MAVTSALIVTSAGLPAVAVDNYPDEPAEAAASVLDSDLLEEALLGAASSDAGSESNPGPNTENIDVDLLGSQLLQIGDLEIPVDQILDFGQVGALASTSEASGPQDADAVSGLVGADGGVTLDGTDDEFGAASLDVLSLARLAGADGLTDEIVDELTVELGAAASQVTAEDGVFLDPDGGVTGPGQYRLGDADLQLHSPAIEDAAGAVSDIGGLVDTEIESLVNDTLDLSALTDLLAAVPGIPEPTLTVQSDLQDTLVEAVVGEPITSENQLVTIDLSTGELQLHLEHLVDGTDPWSGDDGVGMNGLAPNTEVLDEQTTAQVLDAVAEILQQVTQIMTGAVEEALDAVTVNIAFFDQSALGRLDVSWSVPLVGAVNGNFPQAVNRSTGVQAATGALLTTTINGLGNTAAPIFGAVYDLLISDAGDQIFEDLIDPLTEGISDTLGEALSPVFDVLVQVVSLQINRQVTETCTTADGEELLADVEVSALSLGLVESADAGRVGLGNSGARIDACELAIEPTLAVDPGEVGPGGTTTVTGEGYTPDSTVTVQVTDADGDPVGEPVVVDTDENGAFETPLTFPDDAEPGDYTVVGTDDSTGTPAEAALTVIPAAEIDPTLTVDPAEAVPGDTTTVTGEGYTPDSTVTVQLTDADGNPVGEPVVVDTDEDGAFTADLTVPDDAEPGDYTVVGTDDTTGTPAEAALTIVAAPIEPTLTVDPTEAVPGGTTTVTGEGYTPDSTVTVQLTDADGNPVGEPVVVDTDEDGAFTTDLTVPDDAEPGDYTVIGTDDTTGTPAEAALTVAAVPIEPTLTLDPAEVEQGGTTTMSGTGYTPNSTVTVQLVDADGDPVGGPVSLGTDENGAFTTDVVIAETVEPGEYTVVGTDDTTGTPAEAALTIVAAPIEPTLTVDPTEVVPGDTTTVTGEGYTPDSTVTVQLTDADGNPVGEPVVVDTDENGDFTTDLTVPDDAEPGDYTVVATDDTTGTSAEETLTVVAAPIEPTLTVDPTEVVPGDSTTVTGEGYTPDSTVTVQLTDADGNPVGEPVVVDTDENGDFTADLTVPEDAEPGDYTVVATDDTTGTSAEETLTVVAAPITPELTLAPTEVAPGGSTAVSGTGFTPDSTVTVQLTDADGDPVGEPVTVDTDENGAFSTLLAVPEDAEPGDYTVAATDDTTGTSVEAALAVSDEAPTVNPAVTVDPSEVEPGGTVTVSGAGYTPDSTATVQLTDADGNPVGEPVTVQTDENGALTTDLVVPEDAEPGDYTVVVTDVTSGEAAEAPLVVAPVDPGEQCTDPTLTVDPSTVEPGGEVTVTGTGFPAGVDVTVTLTDAAGEPVGEPVVAVPDDTCGFTVTITVPEDTEPGIHVIVAEPSDGSEGAEVPVEVTGGDARTLTAWFEDESVAVGDSQTFFASGFEPGEMVTGVIRSREIVLTGTAADEDGTVSWTFTVPADFETGTHSGIATSAEAGDSAVATFVVEPTAGGGSGNDPGTGTGAGTGTGTGGGGLAQTGADVATLVTGALLLLAAGGLLIRRRRQLGEALATAVGRTPGGEVPRTH